MTAKTPVTYLNHSMKRFLVRLRRSPKRYMFGTVGLLWAACWILVTKLINDPTNAWAMRGQFGDMFGAINALFSGLAFAGLILTILLQHKELQLQRRELKLTRKEFIDQNKTLSLQSFENTFFQLLQSQNEILKLIDYRNGKNVVISSGRDCFRTFYNQFVGLFVDNARPLKNTIEKYQRIYSQHEGDLGHYFRNLYHIYRFIDESPIEDKIKYARLVRAKLSSYELSWLFYNCLSENGIEKFKPLIEKYSVLKNMNLNLIVTDDDLLEYEPNAFGLKINNLHTSISLNFRNGSKDLTYGILIDSKSSLITVTENGTLQKSIEVVKNDFNSTFSTAINLVLMQVCMRYYTWIPNPNRMEILKALGIHIYRVCLIQGQQSFKLDTNSSIRNIEELETVYSLM